MAPDHKNGYKSQTVAVVMVTRNDAAHLARALESVNWAHEIHIVDRGSTDGTIALARKHTKNVCYHPAVSKAQILNDVFTQVKSDWVLLLEPHEWVEEMLRHEIDGALLHPKGTTAGFTITRHLLFQGQAIPCGDGRKQELRLFRRGMGRAIDRHGEIEISVTADIETMDRPLGSEPYRNFEDLFADLNATSTAEAYERLERGKTGYWDTCLLNGIWASKWAFCKEYFLERGMLGGANGLIWCVADSYKVFLAWLKVRALSLKKAG